jgi:hypothetical protein
VLRPEWNARSPLRRAIDLAALDPTARSSPYLIDPLVPERPPMPYPGPVPWPAEPDWTKPVDIRGGAGRSSVS